MPLQAASPLHQDAYHTHPRLQQATKVKSRPQVGGGGGGQLEPRGQGEVKLRADGPLLVPAGGPSLVDTRRDL